MHFSDSPIFSENGIRSSSTLSVTARCSIYTRRLWFRRRNKNRVDKNDDDSNGKVVDETIIEPIPQRKVNQNGKLPNGTVTKSMKINGSGGGGGSSNNGDDKDSPNSMLYGKSAPITIQSNGRASPGKHQQPQIDSEMLKSKIQDAEHKKLCSIDEDFENLSSPRDLPDSINNRVSFYNRKLNQKAEEPVVIKATRTPKISPENSFLESKYTKLECEQNNNCEPVKVEEKTATTTTAIASPEVLNQKQIQSTAAVTQAQDQDQKLTEDHNNSVVEQTKVTDLDADGNQKRNVDAASPSLSICSVQSGDSGKGSSLPRSEATTRVKTTYEFYFPNSLIGQLYGRKRSFINQIKAKTLANVGLSKTRYSTAKLRICTIEGTDNEIDAALAMIRQRLPARRYPNFTMQRIHYALPQTVVPLSTESLYNLQVSSSYNSKIHCDPLYLYLIEGFMPIVNCLSVCLYLYI